MGLRNAVRTGTAPITEAGRQMVPGQLVMMTTADIRHALDDELRGFGLSEPERRALLPALLEGLEDAGISAMGDTLPNPRIPGTLRNESANLSTRPESGRHGGRAGPQD